MGISFIGESSVGSSGSGGDGAGASSSPVVRDELHMIYAVQDEPQSVDLTGAGWQYLNFHTKDWTLKNKATDHFKVSGAGVVYCDAGEMRPIGVQVALYVSSRDAGGTQYTDWALVHALVPTSHDQSLFQSKLVGGSGLGDSSYPTNDSISHRDFYTFHSNPGPLSVLPSGVTDGRVLQFRLAVNKMQDDFADIRQLRAHNLMIEIWPASMVTA